MTISLYQGVVEREVYHEGEIPGCRCGSVNICGLKKPAQLSGSCQWNERCGWDYLQSTFHFQCSESLYRAINSSWLAPFGVKGVYHSRTECLSGRTSTGMKRETGREIERNPTEPECIFILGTCNVQLILSRENYNYFYSSQKSLSGAQKVGNHCHRS